MAYPASAATSLVRVAERACRSRMRRKRGSSLPRGPMAASRHLAILVGDPEKTVAEGGAPLVRAHSECFTGDLLGSLRCDCGPQLRGAIARMAQDPAGGVLLYLAQEGRGIGLVNKLRAYTLQDGGLDTLDANRALGYGADERNFLVAATMLRAVGVERVRLLTNNPDKIAGLAACGIEVLGREAHAFDPNGVNDGYLKTKARRFGHMLPNEHTTPASARTVCCASGRDAALRARRRRRAGGQAGRRRRDARGRAAPAACLVARRSRPAPACAVPAEPIAPGMAGATTPRIPTTTARSACRIPPAMSGCGARMRSMT